MGKYLKEEKPCKFLEFIYTLKSIQGAQLMGSGGRQTGRKRVEMLMPLGFPETTSLVFAGAICSPFFVYCKTSWPSCKECAFFCSHLLLSCQTQPAWTGSAIMLTFNCVPRQKAGVPSYLLRHVTLRSLLKKSCFLICSWLKLKLHSSRRPGGRSCYAERGFLGDLSIAGMHVLATLRQDGPFSTFSLSPSSSVSLPADVTPLLSVQAAWGRLGIRYKYTCL